MKDNSTAQLQSPVASYSPARSKRDYAVEYAAMGFYVFQLEANGKRPATSNDWRKTASKDPKRVHEMWTCPVTGAELGHNIGIAMGRLFQGRYIFAMDIDAGGDKRGYDSLKYFEAVNDEIPASLSTKTASGGEHRILSSDKPVPNSASKIGQHLDIKGEDGYIVAPGSTIDGRAYEFKRALPIAPAPQFLLQAAGEVRKRPGNEQGEVLTELDTDAAIARAKDWLENQAPEAIEGAGGDNTTIKVANRVGDFGVSEHTGAELMQSLSGLKRGTVATAILRAEQQGYMTRTKNPEWVRQGGAECEFLYRKLRDIEAPASFDAVGEGEPETATSPQHLRI